MPIHHQRIEPSCLYFGTPVALLSTLNPDLTPNLAPMSSAWVLGRTVVLGLAASGQTLRNLRRARECVINLPDGDVWPAVERLAPLTGRDPVPRAKRKLYRFEPRKFEAAGLTAVASEVVQPPRVLECPLQFEATVKRVRNAASDRSWAIVECDVVAVHAREDLVPTGTQRVDPDRWHPLLYVFRHYFTTGERLGRNFRAEP